LTLTTFSFFLDFNFIWREFVCEGASDRSSLRKALTEKGVDGSLAGFRFMAEARHLCTLVLKTFAGIMALPLGIQSIGNTSGACWQYDAVSTAFTSDGNLSPFAYFTATGAAFHPFSSGVSFNIFNCQPVTSFCSDSFGNLSPLMFGVQFVNYNNRILVRISGDYVDEVEEHFYDGYLAFQANPACSGAGTDAFAYNAVMYSSIEELELASGSPGAMFAVNWYEDAGTGVALMMLTYNDSLLGVTVKPVCCNLTSGDNDTCAASTVFGLWADSGNFATPWNYYTASMQISDTQDLSSPVVAGALYRVLVASDPYSIMVKEAGNNNLLTFSTLTAPITMTYVNYLPWAITVQWNAGNTGAISYKESCVLLPTLAPPDWCSAQYVYSAYVTPSIPAAGYNESIPNIILPGSNTSNISVNPSTLPVGGAHPFLISPTCDSISIPLLTTTPYTVDWLNPITLNGVKFYPNSDNLNGTGPVFYVGNVNTAAVPLSSETPATSAINTYNICPLQFEIVNNSQSLTISYAASATYGDGTIPPKGNKTVVTVPNRLKGLEFYFTLSGSTVQYELITTGIQPNLAELENVSCSTGCPLTPNNNISLVVTTVNSPTAPVWSLTYTITLTDVTFTSVNIATELLPVTISGCVGYYMDDKGAAAPLSSAAPGTLISTTGFTPPLVLSVTSTSLQYLSLSTGF
jgi:hypothetical protein